jgi:hypothetical protein
VRLGSPQKELFVGICGSDDDQKMAATTLLRTSRFVVVSGEYQKERRSLIHYDQLSYRSFCAVEDLGTGAYVAAYCPLEDQSDYGFDPRIFFLSGVRTGEQLAPVLR